MRKVYVLADSEEDYFESISEYNDNPDFDIVGIDFEYLQYADQITESNCEIWDCSRLRGQLNNLGCVILDNM